MRGGREGGGEEIPMCSVQGILDMRINGRCVCRERVSVWWGDGCVHI